MIEQGKTPDQVSEAFRSLARSDGYEGPGHDYVAGWVYVPGMFSVGVAPAAGLMGAAAGAAISGGANISYQLSSNKPFSYVDASIAATVGGATQGRGIGFTLGAGLGGSYLGSLIKGEDPTYSLLGSAIGTGVGFKVGNFVSGQLKPLVGSASSEGVGATMGAAMSELIGGGISNLGGGE